MKKIYNLIFDVSHSSFFAFLATFMLLFAICLSIFAIFYILIGRWLYV